MVDRILTPREEASDEVVRFRQKVTERTVITGEGSPESIVRALPGQLYMDLLNRTLYGKIDADIGGDTSQGWQLF